MIETLLSLERIYKAYDAVSDELSRQLEVPLCIPNCGKCCGVVFAHRIEAIFAVSSSLGQGAIDSLIDHSEGWLLEKHSQAPTYEGAILGEVSQKLKQEFLSLCKLPCPFLLPDKTCLIYRGRPLVCRAYGVTHMTSPTPDFCPRPLGKGETITNRAWVDTPELKTMIKEFIEGLPDPDWRVVGLLPAAIFKQVSPEKYRAYIEDNKIATAKLIGLPSQYLGLLWQEQMIREPIKV